MAFLDLRNTPEQRIRADFYENYLSEAIQQNPFQTMYYTRSAESVISSQKTTTFTVCCDFPIFDGYFIVNKNGIKIEVVNKPKPELLEAIEKTFNWVWEDAKKNTVNNPLKTPLPF